MVFTKGVCHGNKSRDVELYCILNGLLDSSDESVLKTRPRTLHLRGGDVVSPAKRGAQSSVQLAVFILDSGRRCVQGGF
jgi:hypothetical protein